MLVSGLGIGVRVRFCPEEILSEGNMSGGEFILNLVHVRLYNK